MRPGWTKNDDTFIYRAINIARADGVDKTITVKKFGTDKYICKKYGVDDAKAWAVERIKEMNKKEAENNGTYSVELNTGSGYPPECSMADISFCRLYITRLAFTKYAAL